MKYHLRFFLISVYAAFWGTLGLLSTLWDRSGEGVITVGRIWIRWVAATCRVRVEAVGLENISRDSPQIFMSNHQSSLDVVAIVSTLPVSFRFVMKKEVKKIPFVGWAAAASKQVTVDRGDHEQAVASLKEAVARIRSGTNIIFYPEGTRSVTGELGEFKSGGFHLAIQSGVPIVPVSVSGSQRLTPKGSLRVESGTIKITYGKPIPTQGLGVGDREALKAQVRAAIANGFDPELQAAPRT